MKNSVGGDETAYGRKYISTNVLKLKRNTSKVVLIYKNVFVQSYDLYRNHSFKNFFYNTVEKKINLCD